MGMLHEKLIVIQSLNQREGEKDKVCVCVFVQELKMGRLEQLVEGFLTCFAFIK